MRQLRALAVLPLLLSGCAATSGREWLNSPIEERAHPSAVDVMKTELPADSRPRLSHTVTLGESYAALPPRSSGTGASAAPVQVNVQTQVPVVVNNYGGGYGYGYGYGYGAGYVAPARASRSNAAASQKVGADFPAVPDYGPPAMR
ncbi:MAG: hypothetical protein EOO73_02975 [Myxococcales bacterium]|nr:MAG: hypothetical protein EOO73_02975 [Myxococcales bacterium]